MDHSNNAIRDLLYRISRLEQRAMNDAEAIKQLKQQLATTCSSHVPKESAAEEGAKLSNRVASDITSVVGLKESITWDYKCLKWVWGILLLAGIIATVCFLYYTTAEYLADPTATKVKLRSQPYYEYPPILVCPTAWLDVEKALSLGISLEGLKYSFGYIDSSGDKVKPDNITIGREDFFNFIQTRNFSSFLDYLMAISTDVPIRPSLEEHTTDFESSSACPRCEGATMPKVFMHGFMCYKFQMLAESGKGRRTNVARTISLKLPDRTQGLIRNYVWRVYIGANVDLHGATVPPVYVRPYSFNRIRITVQHSVTLSTDDAPCKAKTELRTNYTPETCSSFCLSSLYQKAIGCMPFEMAALESRFHPRQLCNNFDVSTNTWWSAKDLLETKIYSVMDADEAETCYHTCPYECNRTTFEISRQMDLMGTDIIGDLGSFIEACRQRNVTIFATYIENAAVYQGGVLTLTELNTISFTTLISNVGGTLGLFVGGTMMTFVQVILFFIKYALDKRYARKGEAKVSGTRSGKWIG